MISDFDDLPKSLSEAKNIGATHYFTGQPCKNGHIAPRRVNGRSCLECRREISRRFHAKNAEAISAKRRDDHGKNAESINSRKRRKYAENPQKELDRNRQWRMEKGHEYYRSYYQEKRANDPKYKTNRAMRSGIGKSLKRGAKGGSSWESLIDYTIEELMKHLEKQFMPGMTWENYGDWHIDHEIPKSAFNYETPDDIDFMRCWALSNLRPMWAKDNISKGGKLEKPFQPSLLLSPANDNKPKKEDVA